MHGNMLPSDHVVIEALDDHLAQQAYERVDHLEAVLKSLADLLEVNKTPENVEKAIAFIRKELTEEAREEPEHNWEVERQEATYVPDDQFEYLYDPMED